MLTEVTLGQEIMEYILHMTLAVSQVLARLSLGALTWGDEGTRKGQTCGHRRDGVGWSGLLDGEAPNALEAPSVYCTQLNRGMGLLHGAKQGDRAVYTVKQGNRFS